MLARCRGASRFVAVAVAALAVLAVIVVAARRPWGAGVRWQDEQRRYFEQRASRPDAGPVAIAERTLVVAWEADGDRVKLTAEKCTTCHLGVLDPAMADASVPRAMRAHPGLGTLLRTHPPERVGCTGCHGGDGEDLSMFAHAMPSFRAMGAREVPAGAAAGAYAPPDGARGPSVARDDVPRFLAALPKIEAGCGTCHTRDVHLRPRRAAGAALAPDGAPELTAGRALFRQLRCASCHTVARGAPLRASALPLDELSAKTTPEHLLAFLRKPRARLPKTSMPAFWPSPVDPRTRAPLPEGSPGFAAWQERMKSETLSIAAFLLARSERDAPRWSGGGPPVAELVARRANVTGASAEEGRRLFVALGCLGCHTTTNDAQIEPFRSRERDAAPSLEDAGARLRADWTAWFLEDPARAHAGTLMPSFRLDRRAAASLARYLGTLRAPPRGIVVAPAELAALESAARRSSRVRCNVATSAELGASPDQEMSRAECGELLYAAYGCGSCHAPGAPERGPRALDVPLDGYAERAPKDFGQLPADARPRTWDAYTLDVLDNPRVFGPAERRMPDYDLSARELRALMVYLASLGTHAPQPKLDPYADADRDALARGRVLVADLGCRGCHVVGEEGGDFLAARRALEPAYPDAMAPPPLRREGARVRSDWLFAFLRAPGARGVRPPLHPEWIWGALVPPDKLAPRMPTYALDVPETNALVRYFALEDSVDWPFDAPRTRTLDAAQKVRALLLVNRSAPEGGGCMECHWAGELPLDRAKASLAVLAPDLASVSSRLRDAWVRALFSSPGTHPPIPRFDKSAPDDAERITDFLFGLAPRARLPASGEELRAPPP